MSPILSLLRFAAAVALARRRLRGLTIAALSAAGAARGRRRARRAALEGDEAEERLRRVLESGSAEPDPA